MDRSDPYLRDVDRAWPSEPDGSSTFGDWLRINDSYHVQVARRFPDRLFDMDAMREPYDEVYAYTMGRPGFIPQHVVDAYAAQTASDGSKPMGVIFALVGLYLHIERQFSGGEVQKVHVRMGGQKRQWPAITLPRDRGSMTAADVLMAPEGRERDHAIDEWCRSVWTAFRDSRQTIVDFLRESQIS
jgi:hypothetical protein